MLGDVLKAIRIANEDISIKEVAKMTGLSSSFISETEKNNKKCSLNTLDKLSKGYNIPKSEIMKLDELQEEKNYDHQHLLIEVLKYYLNESDSQKQEQKKLVK